MAGAPSFILLLQFSNSYSEKFNYTPNIVSEILLNVKGLRLEPQPHKPRMATIPIPACFYLLHI